MLHVLGRRLASLAVAGLLAAAFASCFDTVASSLASSQGSWPACCPPTRRTRVAGQDPDIGLTLWAE